MGEADLAFADSLRALVGWNQTPADWRRLLTLEPEGCFVAEWEGQPSGTATTTRHGDGLAWIGMVLVHPERRRHGLGRALLRRCIEHLDAVGCRCIKLDATPEGRPLYESLGFHDEWPLARWEGVAGAGGAALPWVRPYRPGDRAACLAADVEAFGVSRERLLDGLLAAGTVLVAEEEGHLVGYGILRPGSRATYMGALVAGFPAAGKGIARALLDGVAGQTVFWDIPEAAGEAVALAGELGFRRQRLLTRMFRGRNDQPGIPARQFAIADPATG
jgi:GNAT superfamily N-acetyltransferase